MPRGPRLDAPGTLHHAWALLPNHAHLLVRTGRVPLSRSMRSLLRVGGFGQSGRRLASVLGVAPQSVYRAAARGSTETAEWVRILAR